MMRSDHGVNEAVGHQIAFESRQENRQESVNIRDTSPQKN
jgi:hypothetical protein